MSGKNLEHIFSIFFVGGLKFLNDPFSFGTISGDPEVLLLVGGETSANNFSNRIELLGRNDCSKIPM